MPSELSDLIRTVAERFESNASVYPALALLDEEQKRGFTISHSVLHMSKTVGRLAAECESFDHGGSLNVAALREATVKMLVNTLKLADDLQMTADELTAGIGRV
jgi:hypothetical protein